MRTKLAKLVPIATPIFSMQQRLDSTKLAHKLQQTLLLTAQAPGTMLVQHMYTPDQVILLNPYLGKKVFSE